ncbi:MAG: hypothetical protein ACKVE4_10405, partial [Dissulfuribacterales bacterium]
MKKMKMKQIFFYLSLIVLVGLFPVSVSASPLMEISPAPATVDCGTDCYVDSRTDSAQISSFTISNTGDSTLHISSIKDLHIGRATLRPYINRQSAFTSTDIAPGSAFNL